jgi:hypothetical protein
MKVEMTRGKHQRLKKLGLFFHPYVIDGGVFAVALSVTNACMACALAVHTSFVACPTCPALPLSSPHFKRLHRSMRPKPHRYKLQAGPIWRLTVLQRLLLPFTSH